MLSEKAAAKLVFLSITQDCGNDSLLSIKEYASPHTVASVISAETDRYLSIFRTLKAGYVSFSGTEVLNVQSGWIEAGYFSKIETLDLTSDPSILLNRHRYNKANAEFIRNGGTINRIYMVERKNLRLKKFRDPLVKLINLQRDMGVTIGLQYLEDLDPELKQDFILYDSAIALVQETQANYDYTFGRSTAHFNQDIVDKYKDKYKKVVEVRHSGQSPFDLTNQFIKEHS